MKPTINRSLSFWLVVSTVLWSGCATMMQPVPPLASKNIVTLEAPQPVLDLVARWQGNYVLFAHKQYCPAKFDDLAGSFFHCAMINTSDIWSAASAFETASGLKIVIGLQNNPKLYASQFLEKGGIGFMVPSVAEHYGFPLREDLVEIRFR